MAILLMTDRMVEFAYELIKFGFYTYKIGQFGACVNNGQSGLFATGFQGLVNGLFFKPV